MKTSPYTQGRHFSRVPRRGVGTLVNILLLGVLAGLMMGQSTSAAHMTFVMTLTLAALGVSLVFSQLLQYLKIKSERRAFELTVWELERRMDRMIPKRRIKAHGMHSHHPHALEEAESNWMPAARPGRLAKSGK